MPAIALLAAALLASEPPATPVPPTPQEITVYGRIIHDAPHLVKRFGRPTTFDRLGRWRAPVCVKVDGLDPQHDRWVAARVGDIAESVGAPAETGPCTPNIIVLIFAPDAPVRAKIGKGAYSYLNATSKPVDRNQLDAFTRVDGAPAHLFYATGTASSATGATLTAGSSDTAQFSTGVGGAPVVHGGASRLVPMTEPALARVFLVLDGARLKGKSLEQIAAYAAVVTLAEVRTDPPQTDPASITALFTDAPPPDLTLWDRAYLRALYAGNGQINLSMQQSVLADQLVKVVQAAAPPPAPVTAQPRQP